MAKAANFCFLLDLGDGPLIQLHLQQHYIFHFISLSVLKHNLWTRLD